MSPLLLLLLLLLPLSTAFSPPLTNPLHPYTNLPIHARCAPPTALCKPHLVCLNNVCQFPPAPLHAPCSLRTAHFCAYPLLCAGPPHARRCIQPIPENETCVHQPHPYVRCVPTATCVHGVCRRLVVPLGHRCAHGGECAHGYLCAGPTDNQRCVKPMPEGKPCRRDPYWVCEMGLKCVAQVCRRPVHAVGAKCDSHAHCHGHFVCAGPAENKRCVMPMGEGKACRRDPYWVCKAGLECVDQICRRPRAPIGPSCMDGAPCEDGYVCAGPTDNKRCVKPMGEGKACRRDPYWVCKAGLECVDQVCRRPRAPIGPSCMNGAPCEDGYVCAGPTDNKRCVKPMGEGKACRRDPYWVCKAGLECVDQVCRWPRAPIGPSCMNGAPCEDGYVCAGPTDNKRCVKPMGEGKACRRDPYWVCKAGLECVDQVCRWPRAPIGPSCMNGAPCEDGYVCAGPTDNKRCVKPMGEGKACRRDPYWVCKAGLECVDQVCRWPRAPIGPSCMDGAPCEDGYVCAGPTDNKRCVKPMGEGKACRRDPYWVCKAGLECVDQVCRRPRAPIGPSCMNGAPCEDGYVCAGPTDNKRCVKPMGEGKACRRDPYWVCKAGLECVDQVCRRPRAPIGPSCMDGAPCEDGYVCAGPSDNKRCVKPMGEGKACRRDPYWVCASGLKCVGWVCVAMA